MNRLAWYEFMFDLPDEWELTYYSTSAPSGRCEFGGRLGSFGRVSWEHCKRFPDEERILSDYHRRYLLQFDAANAEGFGGIQTAKIGAFMVGFRNPGEPCQALTHLPDCRSTLMWVFPNYSAQRLAEVWAPILKSFVPNTAALRLWSAFGIRAVLPREFELESAACRPADVWLEYQHKNLHRIDLHRWGLPRELLRGRDMDQFIRHVITGHEGKILKSRAEEWRRMDSVKFELESRGTNGMDRLFSSYWRGEGRIWHEPREQRLYAWMQAAPGKVALLDESDMIPL